MQGSRGQFWADETRTWLRRNAREPGRRSPGALAQPEHEGAGEVYQQPSHAASHVLPRVQHEVSIDHARNAMHPCFRKLVLLSPQPSEGSEK